MADGFSANLSEVGYLLKKQEAAHWQPHVTKPLTKTYPLFKLGESSVSINHHPKQTVHDTLKKSHKPKKMTMNRVDLYNEMQHEVSLQHQQNKSCA
jgi:hypothetical protein